MPAVTEKFPVPEYGGVPPVALIITLAEFPLQTIWLVITELAISWVGSEIVTEAETVQLLASVTVAV